LSHSYSQGSSSFRLVLISLCLTLITAVDVGIAVKAVTLGIIRHIVVLAKGRLPTAPIPVVAVVAHALGVVASIRVLAIGYLPRL
jgi:hypothetical protein